MDPDNQPEALGLAAELQIIDNTATDRGGCLDCWH